MPSYAIVLLPVASKYMCVYFCVEWKQSGVITNASGKEVTAITQEGRGLHVISFSCL